MERLVPQETDVRTLSPLALAFVGDGVYELMVRETLLSQANRPNGALHRMARLLPYLSEEETAVYRRGRNAHTARTGSDYHSATGLETLFGYLYLSGNIDRVRALFALAMEKSA